MGKGLYLSKAVAVICVVVAVAAAATIIALAVLYAQEKSKNDDQTTEPTSTVAPEPPTTPSTPKEPWQLYRLPDSLSPHSYKVTLWPRLETNEDGLFIFTGNSSVVFRCVNETDLIIIHSYRLNLTIFDGHQAILSGLNGATAPSLKKTWLEVPTEFLVIQLNSPLKVDSVYELYTEFVGELSDDLGGFYRSEYTEDNVRKYEVLL